MKIVDKLLSKIGVDKLLHFLVGALLTAWASMVNDVGDNGIGRNRLALQRSPRRQVRHMGHHCWVCRMRDEYRGVLPDVKE